MSTNVKDYPKHVIKQEQTLCNAKACQTRSTKPHVGKPCSAQPSRLVSTNHKEWLEREPDAANKQTNKQHPITHDSIN